MGDPGGDARRRPTGTAPANSRWPVGPSGHTRETRPRRQEHSAVVEFAGTQDPACKRTGLPEHGPREAAKARRDAVETREMHGRQREHGAQEAATPRR